jgi:PEP-CTERM motif
MRKIQVTLLLAVMAFSVSAAAGTIIYPIGMASTSSFSNGAGVGETPRGWDFVISQPITVMQLGINAGVSMDITMSLWDATTQTLLGQTTVTSSPFAWTFADLGTPIDLTPGDTFSVIGWADTTNTGVPWYIYNNGPPAAFNPTGTVTYLNTRYDNGIGPSAFPQFTIGSPAQYGVADIGYMSSVPEPGTIALIGSGLALVGVIRRRLNV